ncbi:hypothetical protein LZ554_004735 [Drepanopeziza brunnea f. sp. 'monogermtubi']|nr:hypothetical protein LZ554_004735 [Drepanopeziza brunnea f. sp. 'monogermtubi']
MPGFGTTSRFKTQDPRPKTQDPYYLSTTAALQPLSYHSLTHSASLPLYHNPTSDTSNLPRWTTLPYPTLFHTIEPPAFPTVCRSPLDRPS